MSGLFLLVYGLFRIISENFRLPDPHISYLLSTDWLTLGMVYSLPMILGGLTLILYSRRTSKESPIE